MMTLLSWNNSSGAFTSALACGDGLPQLQQVVQVPLQFLGGAADAAVRMMTPMPLGFPVR